VIGAVTAGQLNPHEGQAVSELLEARQRAVEISEFATRLGALEARIATQNKSKME
jgi:hypothetical protein